jgi:acyl-coenzyme A thioesterase PaaI-like protein
MISRFFQHLLPSPLRHTVTLRLFGLSKVMMIWWLRPRVLELTKERCEILLPLTRRSRNHLHSMYFGALCVGADCAGGLMAFEAAKQFQEKIDIVFQSVEGKFLKRAEGDVTFVCEEGENATALIERAVSTGERHTTPVTIRAFTKTPERLEVATFTLSLSAKARPQ